ncbi:MAG: hypothetical protein P8M76_07090 [Flavobacteriaceae bacterium]|jgi:hypothetical protein|nr:hypothetical protein [Flavobacteriaceae bacterium]|tara:strand:+ start:58 stop:921 length:864 start_codon:yes stop_codon:yes gene_type:complete
MKKQINKIVLLLLSVIVISSCETEDKAIDQVFAGVEYGAVLRKLEITSGSYNLSDLNSAFSVIVEEQDEEYGALLSEVDVYVSKGGNEAMVSTVPASAFTIGEKGLPVTEISVTLGQALDALGLGSNYGVGDVFGIRLSLKLTDGREFSAASASGSLQGSYFSSPFFYTSAILCTPKPGDYVVDMQDSYGDGWQGDGIKVTFDGGPRSGEIVFIDMLSSYSGGPACCGWTSSSETLNVPVGTQGFAWEYTGDSYPGEVSFQIYAPDNSLLLSAANPAPGSLTILNCL